MRSETESNGKRCNSWKLLRKSWKRLTAQDAATQYNQRFCHPDNPLAMSQYARLSSDDAYQMIIDRPVTIIDIRDEDSYKLSHITEATHMDNSGVQSFINETDTSLPLIVCCYHGNMSQSAGAYLAEKGFDEVYSLDGGFAEWQAKYPDDCEPD